MQRENSLWVLLEGWMLQRASLGRVKELIGLGMNRDASRESEATPTPYPHPYATAHNNHFPNTFSRKISGLSSQSHLMHRRNSQFQSTHRTFIAHRRIRGRVLPMALNWMRKSKLSNRATEKTFLIARSSLTYVHSIVGCLQRRAKAGHLRVS